MGRSLFPCSGRNLQPQGSNSRRLPAFDGGRLLVDISDRTKLYNLFDREQRSN
jgi:hypothetical protein